MLCFKVTDLSHNDMMRIMIATAMITVAIVGGEGDGGIPSAEHGFGSPRSGTTIVMAIMLLIVLADVATPVCAAETPPTSSPPGRRDEVREVHRQDVCVRRHLRPVQRVVRLRWAERRSTCSGRLSMYKATFDVVWRCLFSSSALGQPDRQKTPGQCSGRSWHKGTAHIGCLGVALCHVAQRSF